jgi:hypothetical protein
MEDWVNNKKDAVKRIHEVIDYLSRSWHTKSQLGASFGSSEKKKKSVSQKSAITSTTDLRCDIMRTQHSITLLFPRHPESEVETPPHVQIVLRLYSNIAEVLLV